MLSVFIVTQVILVAYMVLHDWVKAPPFNDVERQGQVLSIKQRILSTVVNVGWVLAGLALTMRYPPHSEPGTAGAGWFIVSMYSLLFVGEVLTWWLPYLTGCSYSGKHDELMAKLFERTLKVLAPRPGRLTPDVQHMILHGLTLICVVGAWALYGPYLF